MDSSTGAPSSSAGERPSPTKHQLQIHGPRPPPLSIHKESHKIKKPPRPPQHAQAAPQQPVIIYSVSPKIINVAVADFMNTVQRLTGVSSDDFSSGGDVSPAARLASTEKVVISPKDKGGCTTSAATDELLQEGLDLGRFPGILSPATLPPVMSDMFFSPVTDPLGFSGLLASPGLFPGALGSPTFSPDLFGQIWNF